MPDDRAASGCEWTVNCDCRQHEWCDGYIAPAIFGSKRPCGCPCHERDNPRSIERAMEHVREGSSA